MRRDNYQVRVTGNGATAATLLTLLFIALKLTGYITWSWWLVLAPTLVPIVLVALIVLALLITGLRNY